MVDSSLPHDHGNNGDIAKLVQRLERGDCFRVLADLFKQLSDPTRIKIFWILCHCEECVMNLSAIVGMSSPAVSHHLRGLKAAGLVKSERKGQEVYYSVPDSPKSRMFHQIVEEMLAIACPGISLSGEKET